MQIKNSDQRNMPSPHEKKNTKGKLLSSQDGCKISYHVKTGTAKSENSEIEKNSFFDKNFFEKAFTTN